jgi:tetratricopeptide (TPR) repeat protein
MKDLARILITLLALSFVVMVPISFIYGDFLARNLTSALNLHVDERFTGGKVRARFLDPLGDDHGEGGLTYPRHRDYGHEGVLDLVRYTVYEPITDAPWSREKDFWQLSVTFAEMKNTLDTVMPFSHPVVLIYIDIDGAASGSTRTFVPRAELVEFHRDHPWDIFIRVDGYSDKASMYTPEGGEPVALPVFVVEESNTIYIRLPLAEANLKRLLDGRDTFHYVMVGAGDPLSQGRVMRVQDTATRHSGGGALSSLTPRVYDYLAPRGASQESLLSSYDESAFIYATIRPVSLNEGAIKVEEVMGQDEIARLKQDAAGEKRQNLEEKREALARLEAEGVTGRERAVALFHAEKYAEAEKEFDRILSEKPDHSLALAYKGSLVAMRGGKADSVAESVRLVNRAFEYLDRAVAGAKNRNEKITARMNRGSVSLSVPEQVFNKSLVGARDFEEAAKMMAEPNPDRKEVADAYCKSALGYKRAGMKDKAEIMLLHAKKYPLSSYAKLVLVKHGMNPAGK